MAQDSVAASPLGKRDDLKTTAPLPLAPFDKGLARWFVNFLGKKPEDCCLRFFPHKKNPRKEEINARKLLGIDRSVIEQYQREGRGAYLVINNGGNSDAEITDCVALFVEWDDQPLEWQRSAWQELSLPEPSIQVETGGKSIHTYWVLQAPVNVEIWSAAMERLIAHCKSDRSVKNKSRVMRLPGAWYIDAEGMPAAQTLIVQNNDKSKRYTLDEVMSCIPEECHPITTQSAHNFRFKKAIQCTDIPARGFPEIMTALEHIPQRVSGNNTYEDYRNILWGLIKACEEAGGDIDDAINLMEEHSPSASCGWNIGQVARSGGDKIGAGTFWFYAKESGWDPKRRRKSGENLKAKDDGQNKITKKDDQQRQALAPDQVMELLPQRLGDYPRLNLRTNNFVVGATEYTADDVSRIYLKLSNDKERWPKETTADAFVELSRDRVFDPVMEELLGICKGTEPLPMDQWHHLDLHLLGIDDPIAASFLPQYLISGVARVFRPGCGVRRSPVLIGAQHRGKTALGRILFGEAHWIENVSNLDKDDLMRLQAGWGVELSELNGITRRKDQESLKAFLTARDDVFRVPYGKGVARYERRCVFWGTSNGPPLRDLSGSTRFVCIPVPDRMLPLDWASKNRDALWARAVKEFLLIPNAEEPWDRVSEEERADLVERNSDHQELDPWTDNVISYLEQRKTPPISIPEIFDHLNIGTAQQNPALTARIRSIAENAGWIWKRRQVNNNRKQGFWPVKAEK
jgi:Virulence-associated protein E